MADHSLLKHAVQMAQKNSPHPVGGKVVVALSGGVDSSVAAWLLLQQGYQVEGLFMKNWEEDDNTNYCAAAADLADAQAVCERLQIPLHTVNFAAEYWDQVFQYFLVQYQSGNTPNPDVLCNKEIKFKTFLTFSQHTYQANYMATGHYVRSKRSKDGYQLLRGIDERKDQSYFLYSLTQEQIARTLFPLGGLKKSDVRHIAHQLKLATAKKKESMGICFIGQRRLRDFLSRYLPDQPGKIESVTGEVLGEHAGLFYYTIGQRKGIGIGGISPHYQQPWYVIEKDRSRNVLVVAQGRTHPKLQSQGLLAYQIHWVNRSSITKTMDCSTRFRHQQQDVPCQLTQMSPDRLRVNFQHPQTAIAPGQAVVFYQQEICLGGATIIQALPY